MGVLRGALASLVLVCVLVACDDAPEPKVEDRPTPSVSTSSEAPSTSAPTEETSSAPPALEPEMPAVARENSDAGAESFVRWWIDLVNYGASTGDVQQLDAFSDSRCSACTGVIEAASRPFQNGGGREGGTWTVGALRDLPLDHDADWAAFGKGRVAAEKVDNGDGTSTGYEGGPFYFYAYVTWTDAGWNMRWLRTPEPA